MGQSERILGRSLLLPGHHGRRDKELLEGAAGVRRMIVRAKGGQHCSDNGITALQQIGHSNLQAAL